MSQGGHSETVLLLALFDQSTPSCLKVIGWWGGGPCDYSVSPWSKSFFFPFLGDFYSTWGLLGQGPELGLGPGLDNFDYFSFMNFTAQSQKAPVSMREGISMAKKVKAVQYFECSAKSLDGVETVFDEAVKAALRPRDARKPWCNLF